MPRIIDLIFGVNDQPFVIKNDSTTSLQRVRRQLSGNFRPFGTVRPIKIDSNVSTGIFYL